MIGTRFLAPLLAAMLLSTAAWAQPEGEDTSTQAPKEQQQKTEADKKSGGSTTASKPTSSPSDYRASEKISEDLPVSFPVDI